MTFLSIDPGFGNTKLFGANGSLVMPSLVAINGHGQVHDSMTSRQRAPLDIGVGPHQFYVGAGSHEWGRPVESLDLDRFVGTPEMRALFYGALTRYGDLTPPPDNTELIVGLPLAVLTGDADQVPEHLRV